MDTFHTVMVFNLLARLDKGPKVLFIILILLLVLGILALLIILFIRVLADCCWTVQGSERTPLRQNHQNGNHRDASMLCPMEFPESIVIQTAATPPLFVMACHHQHPPGDRDKDHWGPDCDPPSYDEAVMATRNGKHQ